MSEDADRCQTQRITMTLHSYLLRSQVGTTISAIEITAEIICSSLTNIE